MTTRYYFTTAEAAYDYPVCTTEVRLPNGGPPVRVSDKHGTKYRLVSIRDDRGGTFHENQLPRYASGINATVEAESAEAKARELPPLIDLGIDRTAERAHEAWQKATEREASRLADANKVEEAWALRGFADGLAGRDVQEGREAGEYRLYYVKGYHAASCDY